MTEYSSSGNVFGGSIGTDEIEDGAITLAKLNGDAKSSLIYIPIGGVIAWLKSYTNTPALSSNFVECNGQTLSDAESVYDGQVIPNLNASGGGTQRFLRGSTTSGSTGGSETHRHSAPEDGSVAMSTAGSGSDAHYTDHRHDSQNHLPPYYSVVWIMRIK